VPRPGEVSLAHRGVLFLDELPEFRPPVLDALRAPLEQGVVHIVRARGAVTFPAKFQLVAAMNPCPCGYRTSSSGRCTCDEWMVRRYTSRISGPLRDRFDLRVEIPAVRWSDLRGEPEPGGTTAERRARVLRARSLALHRLTATAGSGSDARSCNAELDPREVRVFCALTPDGEALLGRFVRRFGLSARGCDRILRVARTVADLEGRRNVDSIHLAEALHYRLPIDRRVRSTP
jgi:magnesium chelatase family protein